MLESYKNVVFGNYANFKGRARRSEYWQYFLCNILIFIFTLIGLVLLTKFFKGSNAVFILLSLNFLYAILTFIPSLAVLSRRLHDTEKSAWVILISLIPLGAIILLVFLCTEGTNGNNKYGSDPKNQLEDINEIGKHQN